MIRNFLVFSLLASATPVLAAESVAVPATAADPAPANLVAAREVVDLVLPAASRDQMIEQLMKSMLQVLENTYAQNQRLQAAFEQDPRTRPIFEKAMARQRAEMLATLKAEMPGMLTAMTRAYARRFSVDELHEMQRFFATPAGQAYVVKAPTVLSDPDVLRFIQVTVEKATKSAPAAAKAMADEIDALPPR